MIILRLAAFERNDHLTLAIRRTAVLHDARPPRAPAARADALRATRRWLKAAACGGPLAVGELVRCAANCST